LTGLRLIFRLLCDFFTLGRGEELAHARRSGNVNVVGHIAIHRYITISSAWIGLRVLGTLSLRGQGVRVLGRGRYRRGSGACRFPLSLAVESGHLSRLEAAQKKNGDDNNDIITHVSPGLRAIYLE